MAVKQGLAVSVTLLLCQLFVKGPNGRGSVYYDVLVNIFKMPSSLLFGINNEGRVHTLSTTGTMWREIPYAGQEFKKLSGVPYFLWALGGDHQIYVYVHGLDIQIRVREEAYENEVGRYLIF